MMLRVVLALGLVLMVSACGTKSALLKPNGEPTPKSEKDPSQPDSPITR
ncbi:MAG: hypothetical protein ACLQUZ_04175 [Rhizomicrobium sp.]